MAEEENSVLESDFSAEKVKNVDDDSGITMLDVLEEERELEDDANAVLGGSDDQNCTYPQGYVRRQALYACGTCIDGTQNLAGVCLACSYACHEGHKLFELYTKRSFRCDCGNSKFNKNPCKLCPDKASVNSDNAYNQNFNGFYCTCSRPYPDPDDEIEDEMIQCVICEDWYHGRHLGTVVPVNNEYGEMVCCSCMAKCDFLWAYHVHSNETVMMEATPSGSEVNMDGVDDVMTSVEDETTIVRRLPDVTRSVGDRRIPVLPVEPNDRKEDSAGETCLHQELLNRDTSAERTSAIFWPDGWRSRLCRCTRCMEMYAKKNVLFLLDEEDTVHSYEEHSKAQSSGQSRYDQGMQALSQLDRVRQVEAIHEYNDMTSELKDFLKNFAETKKVVRKEDIDEFFSQMRARKRQKLSVSVPHFCR